MEQYRSTRNCIFRRRNVFYSLNSCRHIQTSTKHSSDLIVIGGGLIGLSIAWEAAKLGAKITVVVGDGNASATVAAAGMLAPQGERLEQSALLKLCVSSRSLYPAFVEEVERTSGMSTDFSSSGFICPSFGDDAVSTWKPPIQGGHHQWLSKKELLLFEPLLSEEVVGGWWFPEDCHINNKKLYESLTVACKRIGVQFIYSFVANMIYSNNMLSKLQLSTGDVIAGERYVVANGCWLRKLIPLPVHPQKGQMISLCNENGLVPLQRVIYGEGGYIVPRKNGEIVLGATVEDNCLVDFKTSAGGIYTVLEETFKLIPSLSQLPLRDTWTGYRPTTPDLLPIFGKLWFENVSVCAGHHRNGILLAPISGKIASRVALDMSMDDIILESDIINAFSVQRFSHASASNWNKIQNVEDYNDMDEKGVTTEELKSLSSESQKLWKDLSKKQEIEDSSEVKLWQVGEDGQLIPIHYRQPPADLFNTKGYGDFTDQNFAISQTAQSNSSHLNGVLSEVERQYSSTKDSATTEWSQSTDAYLDISSGVGDDNYEREFRKAILANLHFQAPVSERTDLSPSSSLDKSLTNETCQSDQEEENGVEKGLEDDYNQWLKLYETVDTNQNIPC
ncbi:glycine oxidase ThiO [Galdieria sulphuraria]|uniref:Glycine oxidase ThiO n=1 Tax=Galdieria sulphuraria TaxID=130081 RepID=M2Y249_GALSU|nr:glycine oxidase ThiO [Galdieria sulphuraria]EME30048.1 glycine oxidase ThiO [Galdieria sulphuraria]|eukprot:XP_005706568.1 glycine oxidase ThiO [Galdieria sulphuraria]